MSAHVRSLPLWLAATATLSGVPQFAAADEESTLEGATLEQVTVTSRRREENIQDVPVSVEVLSGDQMEMRGISRIEDVVANTPNVLVSAGPSGAVQASFSMRGIPRAGFFVDGIWQQSSIGLSSRSVIELESVEVLRGPQGTLYGRDSTGGAIRLQTKKPAETFGARITGTVGSYERRDISANVDVPLTDTLFSKFTVASEKRDGYVDSITIDRSFGDLENRFLRADFLWKPADTFRLRVSADRTEQVGTQANYTLLMIDPGVAGPSPGFGFQVPPYQYYDIIGRPYNCQSQVPECPGGRVGDLQTTSNYNEGPGIDISIDSYTARAEWDFAQDMQLTALTNYTENDSWFYAHFDNSDNDFFSQGTYSEIKSFSQELQLNGKRGPFNWVGGLYYWNLDTGSRFMRWAFNEFATNQLNFSQVTSSAFCTSWTPASGNIPCILVPPGSQTLTFINEHGYAAFGELNWDLTSTLTATLGARFHDQKNTTKSGVFGPSTAVKSTVAGRLPAGDLLGNSGKINPFEYSFNKTTFRLALSNKFTDSVMGYVGYSQGYNGGGISRISIPDALGNQILTDFPYDPETINNFEIGLRSDWLDRRLRLNVTGFFTKWEDIQLSGTVRNPITGEVLPTFLIQNAAAAESKGAEISIVYQPIAQLQTNLDIGLLDTKYTELGEGTDVKLDSKFGQSPKTQVAFGAQWNQKVSEHDMVFRLDYSWTSGFMRSYVPGDQSTTYTGRKWEQPSYGLLNARIAFLHKSGKWEAALFATNLTDERYTTGGFFSPLLLVDDGTIGRPREAGVSFKLMLN